LQSTNKETVHSPGRLRGILLWLHYLGPAIYLGLESGSETGRKQ